jgi:hypothetical protein
MGKNQDPGWVKIRIREKHPGSATLIEVRYQKDKKRNQRDVTGNQEKQNPNNMHDPWFKLGVGQHKVEQRVNTGPC